MNVALIKQKKLSILNLSLKFKIWLQAINTIELDSCTLNEIKEINEMLKCLKSN